jgi:branched-chain amino acid transport system permease protein
VLQQQIVNGIMIGVAYGLIGLGFTLVVGVLKVINLAHPAIIITSGFLAILAFESFGNAPLAVAVAVVGAAALGLIVYFVAIRPIPRRFELGIFLATFAFGMILENIVANAASSRPRRFPELLPTGSVEAFGMRVSSSQVVATVSVLVLLGFLWWLVQTTDFGRAIRAVAENSRMASYMGVNVGRVSLYTVMIAAALGGLAAVVWGLLFGGLSPFAGHGMSVKGLTIMIIGGVGSAPGTLLAGLLLGLVEAISSSMLGTALRDAVAFVVLAIVLLVRPQGLIAGSEAIRRA